MADATFRAGGLASGLDTNSIVDALTNLQKRPISLLATQKKSFEIQLSALGNLRSKLTALGDKFSARAATGILTTAASTTSTAFSAVSTGSASEGAYSIQVEELAVAAKARSTQFASSLSTVAPGTLRFTVDGADYDVSVAGGDTLAKVRDNINDSGAPISAAIVNDGAGAYLVVTNKNSGYEVGQSPSTALSVQEFPQDGVSQMVGLSVTTAAKNARVTIDGLTVERRTNSIADAIPGVTLSVTAKMTSSASMTVTRDAAATKAALQELLDAYNGAMSVLNGELKLRPDTDRNKTLGGDPATRLLQQQLQALVIKQIPGLQDVRTLADLGVKSGRDGTLSIDDGFFNRALENKPEALNAIVGGTNGVAAAVASIVTNATRAVDGLVTARESNVSKSIRRIEDDTVKLQARVDSFRESLVRRFTAMEETVSRLKSTGTFLSNVKFPGFTQGGDS